MEPGAINLTKANLLETQAYLTQMNTGSVLWAPCDAFQPLFIAIHLPSSDYELFVVERKEYQWTGKNFP